MNAELIPSRLIAMDPPTTIWANRISAFLQSQVPNPLSARNAFAHWKLCINEAHHGFASAMVTSPTDQIVSTCTITPKRLWREGKEKIWGEIGDTFTRSDHIRKGMFGNLVNETRTRAQAAGIELIYGLPNDQSLPGYINKLSFKIKDDLILNDFFTVLSTKALGTRNIAAKIPFARAILCNRLISNLSRMLTRAVFGLLAVRLGNVRIQHESTFGEDFDCLWRRARMSLVNSQVRDAQYLVWRYRLNPFPFVVHTARRNGELLGYVVTLTLPADENRTFSHTIVIDWLYVPDPKTSIPRALLFAAVRQAFKNHSDVISALMCKNSTLPLPFLTSGFLRKSHPTPVIFHGNDLGQSVISDRSHWHFTLSDTDSF